MNTERRKIKIGDNGLGDKEQYFTIPKEEAVAVAQALKNEPSKLGSNKPSHTTAYLVWTFLYGNQTGFEYVFMPNLLSAYTGLSKRQVQQSWSRLEELGIIQTRTDGYWLERCYRKAKMKKYSCGDMEETLPDESEHDKLISDGYKTCRSMESVRQVLECNSNIEVVDSVELNGVFYVKFAERR